MTPPPEQSEALLALAARHEKSGLRFAWEAFSDAPWKHDHAQDTVKASHHFTVAAALRSLALQTGGE